MAKSVTKLFLQHTHLIDTLVYAVADHAEALYDLFPKCECGEPVTVKHVTTDSHRCDRCCAEAVQLATELEQMLGNFSSKPEDEWVDLPSAAAVRRVVDHYRVIREDAVIH